MGQSGFFDLSRRYEGLDAKQDPLVAILAAVPFELFRPQFADSDDAAHPFRSDPAHHSELMPPGC